MRSSELVHGFAPVATTCRHVVAERQPELTGHAPNGTNTRNIQHSQSFTFAQPRVHRMVVPLDLRGFALFEVLARWTRLLERMAHWAEGQHFQKSVLPRSRGTRDSGKRCDCGVFGGTMAADLLLCFADKG